MNLNHDPSAASAALTGTILQALATRPAAEPMPHPKAVLIDAQAHGITWSVALEKDDASDPACPLSLAFVEVGTPPLWAVAIDVLDECVYAELESDALAALERQRREWVA